MEGRALAPLDEDGSDERMDRDALERAQATEPKPEEPEEVCVQ